MTQFSWLQVPHGSVSLSAQSCRSTISHKRKMRFISAASLSLFLFFQRHLTSFNIISSPLHNLGRQRTTNAVQASNFDQFVDRKKASESLIKEEKPYKEENLCLCSRRRVLKNLLQTGGVCIGMGFTPLQQIKSAEAAEQFKLEERLQSSTLKNPGGAKFGDPKQLFLPKWLFGTWNVTATFQRASYPQGPKYVPAKFRGGNIRSPGSPPGSSVTYIQRYFSTLPDTTENQIKVTLGQVPKSEVVPDRAFNTQALLNAYAGYKAVDQVQYDPRKNPRQLSIQFSEISPDLRPLGPGKMEVYFNKLEVEEHDAEEYLTSEYQRAVSVGSRSVVVTDAEVLTKYIQKNSDEVVGYQRISGYLVPNPNDAEGAMYMEVGGKAVAIFDYSFEMTRINEGCVETPKGFLQCQ